MTRVWRDYDDWKDMVDKWVQLRIGCGIDDLPDVPLRDWYDQHLAPVRAASRAIRLAAADGKA